MYQTRDATAMYENAVMALVYYITTRLLVLLQLLILPLTLWCILPSTALVQHT